jgi:glycosyltransferase involved in cell wall biosynthesis
MTAVVVHDGTTHPGGAVDVVLSAAKVLDADLVVGFSGKDLDWWTERAPNDVRILSDREESSTLVDVMMAWRWLNLDLDEYDTVFSSGPATKFYQPYDDQRVVHYMHHPPLNSLWFDGGLFDYGLKVIDRIETWSIPTLIANSELTAERMRSHYNRDPEAVIEPPVDTARFEYCSERYPNEVVMVGRLEERKRPLTAVRAFQQLARDENPPQLHLVGDGPLRPDVERAAGKNVHVHGYVDDDRLVELVQRAWAGLFLARREDFGITPVEYMAAGLPVIGVDEPNTNRQVVDGETGVLVDPDPAAVAGGVQQALGREWDRAGIREAAERYRPERFAERLGGVIEE